MGPHQIAHNHMFIDAFMADKISSDYLKPLLFFLAVVAFHKEMGLPWLSVKDYISPVGLPKECPTVRRYV